MCDTAHRPGVGEGRRVGVAEERIIFSELSSQTVFVSYIIFFKMASTALKEPADVTMQNDMVWHDKKRPPFLQTDDPIRAHSYLRVFHLFRHFIDGLKKIHCCGTF